MVGLVIAITKGLLPSQYIAYALSEAPAVKVPVAPAGNLVLAECFFVDKMFTSPSNLIAQEALRTLLKEEMSGEILHNLFDLFSSEVLVKSCELRAKYEQYLARASEVVTAPEPLAMTDVCRKDERCDKRVRSDDSGDEQSAQMTRNKV